MARSAGQPASAAPLSFSSPGHNRPGKDPEILARKIQPAAAAAPGGTPAQPENFDAAAGFDHAGDTTSALPEVKSGTPENFSVLLEFATAAANGTAADSVPAAHGKALPAPAGRRQNEPSHPAGRRAPAMKKAAAQTPAPPVLPAVPVPAPPAARTAIPETDQPNVRPAETEPAPSVEQSASPPAADPPFAITHWRAVAVAPTPPMPQMPVATGPAPRSPEVKTEVKRAEKITGNVTAPEFLEAPASTAMLAKLPVTDGWILPQGDVAAGDGPVPPPQSSTRPDRPAPGNAAASKPFAPATPPAVAIQAHASPVPEAPLVFAVRLAPVNSSGKPDDINHPAASPAVVMNQTLEQRLPAAGSVPAAGADSSTARNGVPPEGKVAAGATLTAPPETVRHTANAARLASNEPDSPAAARLSSEQSFVEKRQPPEPSSAQIPNRVAATAYAASPEPAHAEPRAPFTPPPAPARASEHPEPAPSALPQAARDIRLRLAGDEKAGVEVRMIERAGEVRVAVRSADAELAQSMRSGLSDLAEKLSGRGFSNEIWRPEPVSEKNNPASANPGHPGQGKQQEPGGQQSRQQQSGKPRPEWLKAFLRANDRSETR